MGQEKSELTFGLIGVFLLVMAGIYFGFQYRQGNSAADVMSEQENNVPASLKPVGDGALNGGSNAPDIALDASEVAKHNAASDCWIVVHGTVYAVTGYMNIHPGGRNMIMPYCGRDATAAFDTRGGTGSHSGTAARELASLAVGKLGSAIPASQVQAKQRQIQQQLQSNPVPTRREKEDEEYEDD